MAYAAGQGVHRKTILWYCRICRHTNCYDCLA